MSDSKIEFRNFNKYYGEKPALKNINLTIQQKEFFVLFGPSGAGKTTMLKVIAGLEYGNSGELILNNEYSNYRSPQERNVRMAFENYSLYPHFTVFKNLASPLIVKKIGKDEIKRRVVEIAKTLGIDKFLERLPRELSGGQKQRVALGRALIIESDIFLLDEPLAHLDAKIRNELRAEFQNIKSFLSNSTVIYVTHDYLEALSLGDRIAVIKNGEIVQVGKPYEIYNNPCNAFVAQLLGQPEMNLIETNIDNIDGNYMLKKEDLIIPMPERFTPYMKEYKKKNVIFGCRPQHWFYSAERRDEKDYFKSMVEAYEIRNYKGVILSRSGSVEVTILCENYEEVEEEKNIWIKPDTDHMYLFDIENGENIVQINEKKGGNDGLGLY